MMRLWRPLAAAVGSGPVEVTRARGDALAFVTPAVWLAVGLVVARLVPAIALHEPWIDPDESTFLEGGTGFSPVVGPLAGALGVSGYLAFNAGVSVLLVLVAAALAHEWGGEPGRTAIVVAVAPALFWGAFVMPDLVGALGVVAWALALSRNRPWIASLVLVLSVAVDATLSFVALGWMVAALLVRSHLVPAATALGGAGLVSLTLLRYGQYTDVRHDESPLVFLATAAGWGALAVALVLLPLVPAFAYGLRFPRSAYVPVLGVALATFVAAGYVGAGSGLHANARYGLPLAVLVLCGLSREGFRASARMLVWGCLIVLALGILTPADESEALWIAALLSPAGYGLALLLGGLLGWRGWPALGLALQSVVLVVVDLANSEDVRDGLPIAVGAIASWSGAA
jgi:hypothetical protein